MRVTLKPPPLANESSRVKKLMCADFVFEMNRLADDAKIRDTSLEVLPYMSAHMYMTQKNVPSEVQEKFWDEWPKTLDKIVDRCEKNQLQMFYAEVLVPALDGAMPTGEDGHRLVAVETSRRRPRAPSSTRLHSSTWKSGIGASGRRWSS